MSIQECIKDMKTIQSNILDFLEDESAPETNFIQLQKKLVEKKITENQDDFDSFLLLIANISENHHRNPSFFQKIEMILLIFKDEIIQNYTNIKIFRIFENNYRILLFLFTEGIIKIDKLILPNLVRYDYANIIYYDYFLPEINSFIENEEIESKYLNRINKNQLQKTFNEIPKDFYDKRLKGENDGFICELIRNDSIEDFIIKVNKTNLSLESTINFSIFETNSFLLNRNPSLIEYAAFYGSIQIFQYLLTNNVKLTPDLWLYAIHSQNAELIYLLEENEVKPLDSTFRECYKESIKCYHNNITYYIKNTYLQNENDNNNNNDGIIKKKNIFNEYKMSIIPLFHRNYEFFPNDFNDLNYPFYVLCHYEYTKIARFYLESKKINPNFLFDIDNFEKVAELNGGVYGPSFIVKNKFNGKKYMLKNQRRDVEYFEPEEIEIQIMNKYPSLLEIKGYSPINIDEDLIPSFFTNYYQNGSLDDYFKTKMKSGKFILDTKDYILILGIAISLNYLHNHNIVHNTLKPSNVLIDDNFYPIISDFGILKETVAYYDQLDLLLSKHLICYMPPEYYKDAMCNYKSNIYTFSLMIYQILTGNHPFPECETVCQYKFIVKILKGFRPDVSMIDNEAIVDFLQLCWHDDIDKRPSISKVIDFITGDKFCSYFESLDYKLIINYLNIFGDEFNHLKEKFLLNKNVTAQPQKQYQSNSCFSVINKFCDIF